MYVSISRRGVDEDLCPGGTQSGSGLYGGAPGTFPLSHY